MSSNPTDTKTSKKISLIATAFPSGEPNHSSAQTAQLKVIPPTDIVMFVAGTTDPINTTAENHQANKGYWRDVKKSQENLWKGIKEINPPDNRQFHDLHIEETFFSWSGDNNHDKRVEAAERLLDLFKRVYPKFKNKVTHLHLIGHSHGGNVINEFTNLIVNNPNFPEKWRVKSITYLSTPFFQKQHQLNHTKLHPNCKIINVHNDYDLTQRVIADFTLKNLEILIQNLNSEEYEEAKKEVSKKKFKAIIRQFSNFPLERLEMVELWRITAKFVKGIEDIISTLVKLIEKLEGKTTILQDQKQELIDIMTEIKTWAITQRNVLENRIPELMAWAATPPPIGLDVASLTRRILESNRFTRRAYFNDVNLQGLLPTLNTILDIPARFGTRDFFGAYLIDMLASIVLADASGISDIIDDTLTTPKEQVKGAFKIVDIPITDQDKYNTKSTKDNFEGFVQPIEMCVRAKRPDALQEVLVRLLSQLVSPDDILLGIRVLDFGVELLVMDDDNDEQLDILQENLERYLAVIRRFSANLITEEDQNNDELTEKPGSIPYFAMVSHSLSHTKFWNEAKEALMSSFSSGKNPSYKPNKE